ncbi:MAG: hypothetical protein C4K60_09145 [Ideonella sp. MAG2]|nr:MAG: hypothetical protein C4K60_09145 [Ideonella sp. MAG2]
MASSISVPQGSLLSAYAAKGAFTDCYAMPVEGSVDLAEFLYAFYTTPLFKAERWLLATALGLKATDQDARLLSKADVARYSAWRVESRSPLEVLMDAGQTRSWLSVQTMAQDPSSTALLFGSAVVPVRPGGKFGLAFHALLGFHRLYSKLLLRSAARRVIRLRQAQAASKE